MLTLNPLRSTIVALGLFAGMASAQAALTIHFEEDVASGQLNITFSGNAVNPFAATSTYNTSFVNLSSGNIAVANPTYYANPAGFGWNVQNMLWLTETGISAISNSGTGGFMSIEMMGLHQVEILSSTNAATGDSFVWDGEITYLSTLAAFGLNDGETGTITFTLGGQSLSVDWAAVVIPVPEPATYALVLGLGIAAVALLRRRARS